MPRKSNQQKIPPLVNEEEKPIVEEKPILNVVEKPKRKARFERGSIEAKEHMKKLREIKAQKKASIVVV